MASLPRASSAFAPQGTPDGTESEPDDYLEYSGSTRTPLGFTKEGIPVYPEDLDEDAVRRMFLAMRGPADEAGAAEAFSSAVQKSTTHVLLQTRASEAFRSLLPAPKRRHVLSAL